MKIVLYPHLKPWHPALKRFGSWPRFSKKRETLVYQLDKQKSTVRTEFLHQQRTVSGSIYLILPPFSKLKLHLSCTKKGAHQKAKTRHSRKLPKQIIRAVMTGSLSAWREDDFGVTDEMSIKNNMFAIITEQEEVKSLTSPCAARWAVTQKEGLHQVSITENINTHTHTGRKRLLTPVWCKKLSS